MNDSYGDYQVRQDDDGYRTPAIEDDHHPLNVWRSRQGAIESYFPPQDPTAREQFARLRRLDTHNTEECLTGSRRRKNEIHLPWKDRLKHTTWAYFTMCMATGGLANVLHAVPFRSDWLYYVGLLFFFINLILYVLIWSMLLTRFLNHPSTFRSSLVHPTESLFVPAFVVSLGTICITIVEYGANNAGQWLTKAVLVLFWVNVFLAIVLSVTIYMILWSSLTFTIAQMTPIWIFPAYPLLIIGPHAANLAAKLQNTKSALSVIVGGFTVQGIGFLVSLTIYSAFVYRLMTQKLPADPSRPGMFVSVGPAAFTCSGTIGMAQSLRHAIVGDSDPDVKMFMDVPVEFAANVLRLVANWMGLWLWGLAIWFFFVSVISNVTPLYTHQRLDKEERRRGLHKHELHAHKIPFAMTWYSYIFPQTALTTATFRVAEAFDLHPLNILGCVMTGLLVAMWFFVVSMMVKAIIKKEILWPDMGEDKDEGGFVRPLTAKKQTYRPRDIEADGAAGASSSMTSNDPVKKVSVTGAGKQKNRADRAR